MATSLRTAAESYLRAKALSRGTRNEYLSTLRKWDQWGGGTSVEQLQRKDLREFLDWVFERAVRQQGINPGRTTNKAREHLRAILSWIWEQELIDTLPRFPGPREQRNVAGRHYLTKAEINALYFATHMMERPRLVRTVPYWPVLAVCACRVLQLRGRYGDCLEGLAST
jgi:site-specific recombinase XerD